MRVWRICKAKHAATAFSGEGARLYSGRWNPVGVPMVYTSSSLALAALEFFVHLDPGVAPEDLVSAFADIPSGIEVPAVAVETLPGNWRATELTRLQELGAAWAASRRSAALQVPPVVVQGDWNVLLNPAHPDFQQIAIDLPKPWSFDRRIFKA